jgi:hypothetical protein
VRLGFGMAVLAAALAVLSGAVVTQPAAQSPDRPHISVLPTIVAQAEGPTPIQIRIGPAGLIPQRSFVNLRGLPPNVGLTEGYAIAPGAWAVPLNALSGLTATVPAGASGRSEVTISLMSTDGRTLATATTELVIEPRQPASAPEDLAAAKHLLARGEASLANGNVEIARQFLLRAAEAGLAAAALRLGATYDPAELGRMKAEGIVADAALARKWYERARDLGAPEAAERLARLGGGS